MQKKEMSNLSDEGSGGDLAKGRKKAIIFLDVQGVSKILDHQKLKVCLGYIIKTLGAIFVRYSRYAVKELEITAFFVFATKFL